MRVRDLLAVVGRLAEDGREEVGLIGVGSAGPIVLHAAALDGRIRRVRLERSLLSWTDVATTPIGRNQLTNVVPGPCGRTTWPTWPPPWPRAR
jgi:hypothetical protein